MIKLSRVLAERQYVSTGREHKQKDTNSTKEPERSATDQKYYDRSEKCL